MLEKKSFLVDFAPMALITLVWVAADQRPGKETVMALKVRRVDTWAAALEDKPGSLAAKLEALAKAGVNLQFMIARRAPDRPGMGVVFVTPITGAKGRRAAEQAGFQKTESLHTVEVQGTDKAGRASAQTQALANAGLNLRGVSGAAIGTKFIAYVALDTQEDADKAVKVLRRL